MSNTFHPDPVIEEIHAVRAQMLLDCEGDHTRLMQQVVQRQQNSGRTIIKAPLAKPNLNLDLDLPSDFPSVKS